LGKEARREKNNLLEQGPDKRGREERKGSVPREKVRLMKGNGRKRERAAFHDQERAKLSSQQKKDR